ncbi:MAG: chloride channel protein, partial [Muribaculaceae bacterium]|nr:chloride channel protein [Muribaculaceae bacterium]
MTEEKRREILKRNVRRFGRGVRRARIGYLRWQNVHIPESVVLIMIALLIGVSTGIAAATLKELVRLLNRLVLTGVRIGQPDFRLLLWPLAGIFLTGIYQRYVVRGSVARGTRIIRQDLDAGRYRLSPFTVFNPVLGCSATIGTGSTGGTEGPTALSGAAIGSVV